MYTESRNNFSVRSVILQFLFVALFIFILLWLFPTKTDLKKATKSSDNGGSTTVTENADLSILYDRIFNENLMSMKEGAQSYFTIERLPGKTGESVILTLQEMLDKKIVLPFKDKNGNQCSKTKSYVKVTKKNDEYVMKVNLKCGEEENYLLVYMGCYDYCSKTVCEKKGTPTKVYNVKKKASKVHTVVVKTPKKYYCKVVNGKYYDKHGYVVSKASYERSCHSKVIVKKYYCRVVNGKYYDNNGNVVSKEEYKKACDSKKYYCRVVNGKYYDNHGNVVSKEEYKKACEPTIIEKYYCKLVNGKYYDDNGNVVSKEEYKKACLPSYRTICEYKKTSAGVVKYSEWSAWTEKEIAATSNVEVQKKTSKYRKQIGWNVTTKDDLSKPITKEETVVVGSSTTKVCTKYTVDVTVNSYKETLIGTVKLTSAPANLKTSSYRYEYVGKYNYYCTNECTYGVVYLYRVYQITPVTSSSNYRCASYSTYTTGYTTQRMIVTGYEKITEKEPVYEYYTKTSYRSRTKSTTPGSVSYKWSTYNDLTLLNLGYVYTGVCKTELVG